MPTGFGGKGGATLTAFQYSTEDTKNISFTADNVWVSGVILPTALTFSHITFDLTVADAGAGVYDIGLYSLGGTLVANVGAIRLNIATGTTTLTFLQGSQTIQPGLYALATTNHGATNAANLLGGDRLSAWIFNASYAASSGGVLPASITALTVTPNYTVNNAITFILS